MKFAVVSFMLPPSFSGQSMMLYHLLKNADPADYCLISPQSPDVPANESYSARLPGRYFQVSREAELWRGFRYGLSVFREGFNVTYAAHHRARQIARIVRQEGCEAILGCSSGNDLLDVPSAFYASRMTRLPLYVYEFDTYSHMWLNPQTRFLGRLLEPIMLKRAAGIIVTNESVRDLLRDRYGVDSHVIHNPCDLSAYNQERPAASNDGEVEVVYTGAVYEAHYDALRNLVKAIDLLGRPHVKLHLYTTFPQDKLAAEGIRGPVVFHGHLPIFKIPAIQQQADVLFLPLAFTSPYPELIRVSSPSKVGEFLASRTPVLVHAPPDSFIARYFRQHDCGLVVDRDDPSVLAEGLKRLLDEPQLGQRLAANARERAVADFSLTVAQTKFASIMGLSLASAATSETSSESVETEVQT
jgi:glycosyltransferase involved in cell wall biosynthesis